MAYLIIFNNYLDTFGVGVVDFNGVVNMTELHPLVTLVTNMPVKGHKQGLLKRPRMEETGVDHRATDAEKCIHSFELTSLEIHGKPLRETVRDLGHRFLPK